MQSFKVGYAVIVVSSLASPGWAGMPPGVVISANEQIGDLETGQTVASGHAELTIADRHVAGRAEIIEIQPKVNAVIFRGNATLSSGHRSYVGDVITCSLDFMRCSTGDAALPVESARQDQTAVVTSPR